MKEAMSRREKKEASKMDVIVEGFSSWDLKVLSLAKHRVKLWKIDLREIFLFGK